MITLIKTKNILNALILVTIVIVGFTLSLYGQSQFSLNINDVWNLLTAYDDSNINQQVILSLRLPRSLTAALIGFNLGAAGLLMQGLTRNPLASPTLFAISSGAACLTALNSLTIASIGGLSNESVAFVGALTGGLLVFLLGGGMNTNQNTLRLVLAGIAINGLFTSLTRAALIIADDMAFSLLHWLSGSLSDISWSHWMQLWPLSLLGLLIAISTCRGLNLNALGEQTASSLGVNVTWLRIRICLAVLFLTSISVSIAGPIVFVGLIAPHLARLWCNGNHFTLLPVSALSGAALVCWADLLSRSIIPPAETPVGIITALIGTPFFIYLILRGKQ